MVVVIACRARHVLPVTTPPVEDGAVVVEAGRVVAVGPARELLRAIPSSCAVRELGDVVLLPGLVNAHTHLEFSWMRERPLPRGDWRRWVEALIARRHDADDHARAAAAARALDEARARGTVALAEVTNAGWTAPLIRGSSLAATVFVEVFGFRDADAPRVLERARPLLVETGGVLTAHAPHTTSSTLLRAVAERSAARSTPLSIHVAESAAEVELLRDGGGPARDVLLGRQVWDEAWRAPGCTPVELCDRHGLLTGRTLAVHCVHVGAADRELLAARRCTVVTCPRSNRWLGVGRAPVPEMLAMGIPVALGTDSLASSPDLDLLAEMAFLRAEHPQLDPAAVLRMATVAGAWALGLAGELGEIAPGARAALLEVPLRDGRDDPLEAVTSGPAHVRWVP